jgi:hypothetical protein
MVNKKKNNSETKKKVSTIDKLKSNFLTAINPQKQKQKKAFKPQVFTRPTLTKEQQMLQEIMFNGERNWGTGTCLPKIDRTLTSGGGLINNGDIDRETGRMFGIK